MPPLTQTKRPSARASRQTLARKTGRASAGADTSVSKKDFARLYKQIPPEKIPDDVFTLVGKIFPVITAGKESHFNSMTASGGGFGLLFRKPATWCVLRSDRYTLELIQKWQTYTMSYFPKKYMNQIVFLGSKSGRDSAKMKEITLTSLRTPSGNISYKEARLIIECKLTQITKPSLNDFYSQAAKNYLKKAYKKPSDYRKYVFGEIAHVWIRKK